MSNAGAIHLKDPRFQWLQKGAKKGEWIDLSPLDWLKLKVFENIEVDEKAINTIIKPMSLLDMMIYIWVLVVNSFI